MNHDEFKKTLLERKEDAQAKKQFDSLSTRPDSNNRKFQFNVDRIVKILNEYQDIFELLGYPVTKGPTSPIPTSIVPSRTYTSITDKRFLSQLTIRGGVNSDVIHLFSVSYRNGKELEPEKNLINHSTNEVTLWGKYVFIPKAEIENKIQQYITSDLLKFSPI